MTWISNYETMILGEDGESPILPVIERCLAQAKGDNARLRIEIRTKPMGVPNSRGEHSLVADPDNTTPNTIMQVLIERLNESPGETYNGEIRINFMQAGTASNRYASFTRQVNTTAPPEGNVGGGGVGLGPRRISRLPYVPTGDGGDDGGGDDGGGGDGGIDNNYVREGESMDDRDPLHRLRGMPQINVQGSLVTDTMARQWLETTMGLLFRSNAQMIAMFERSTRMMESITMRYGLPEAQVRGITDVKNSPPSAGENQGLGLLPMLLNAAAQLAKSDSPAAVAKEAVEMAQGKPPPAGAARMAAIQGAGKLVRNLTHGGQNRRHEPEPDPEPIDDEPEDPDGGDGGGGMGGGGRHFDDHASFDFGREDEGGDEGDAGPPERSAAELTPEALDPSVGNSGAPDLTGLPPDEMKRVFLEWIRADPSRKQTVMDMLPELSKEIL